MKTLTKDLTQEQKKAFTEEFYANKFWDKGNNIHFLTLWGCPWNWNENLLLEGETAKEMANNFFNKNLEYFESYVQRHPVDYLHMKD